MTRNSILIVMDELLRLEPRPEERVAIEDEYLEALSELELGEHRVAQGAPLS